MSRINPIFTAPSEILSAGSANAAADVASRPVSAAAMARLFIAILPGSLRLSPLLQACRFNARGYHIPFGDRRDGSGDTEDARPPVRNTGLGRPQRNLQQNSRDSGVPRQACRRTYRYVRGR